MRELSITRALQTLKLLDEKINKAMNSITFIEVKKNNIQKVANGMFTVDEYNEKVKSTFQSVNDLIEQRKKIKSLIVKSNAENFVEIAGMPYIVADAIERKNSIEYEKELLKILKQNFNKATQKLEVANTQLESANQKLIETLVGSDKSNKDLVKSTEEVAKNQWENNKMVYVDPLNIKKIIDKMENDIIEFENEVDMCLSEANSRNTIKIEE